jgi:hypothetical protein
MTKSIFRFYHREALKTVETYSSGEVIGDYIETIVAIFG